MYTNRGHANSNMADEREEPGKARYWGPHQAIRIPLTCQVGQIKENVKLSRAA